MPSQKPVLEVGCAIIAKGGKLLIAQRKPGDHLGGYWEFPGGKRENCETIEACLIREVEEELGVSIRPRKLLREVTHRYPERELLLCFWICDWSAGEACAKDCQDFRWISPSELTAFKFPPADADIIRELILNQHIHFISDASSL